MGVGGIGVGELPEGVMVGEGALVGVSVGPPGVIDGVGVLVGPPGVTEGVGVLVGPPGVVVGVGVCVGPVGLGVVVGVAPSETASRALLAFRRLPIGLSVDIVSALSFKICSIWSAVKEDFLAKSKAATPAT